METLSKILTALIIITAVALVLFVAFIIYTAVQKKKKTEALFNSKKARGEGFVPSLIKINFPNAKVIRRAELQVPNGQGGFSSAPADLILIETCGIVVMKLCGESGAVDNPENGAWTVTGKNGSFSMPNPIDANQPAVQAITSLLNDEAIYNVPIYNVAVFYGKKAVYRNRSPKALTAKSLLTTLKDLNQEKFLSKSEISDTYTAIRRHLPRQEATKQKVSVRKNK